MKRRNTYHVAYWMAYLEPEREIDVIAGSKGEAWETATFEAIPNKEGSQPYNVVVESVTYQNGNYKRFV